MKLRSLSLIILLGMFGCNDSDFSGGSKAKEAKKTTPKENPPPIDEDPPKTDDLIQAKPSDIVEIDGVAYGKTQMIAAIFEDSKKPGAWVSRDIRVCVTGNFLYDKASRKILGSGADNVIKVDAYKNPGASCRHNFHLEVVDASGNVVSSDKRETSPTAGYQNSSIKLNDKQELRLSWSWISGSQCEMSGRDYHTRATQNDRPAPKVVSGSCGDFSP